jgi:hypothetical protein
VPFQVFLDVLLPDIDTRVGRSARFRRFSLQFLLQARKADAGTILEFQTGRAKRLRLTLTVNSRVSAVSITSKL